MIIVGVGVGPKMLTYEAIEIIKNASVIYGSDRAIELAQEYINCKVYSIKNYKTLHLLPKEAVLLSTGDPMFSGLGKYAGENDRVVSGISSIQASCARFHVEMMNLAIITSHGRDPTHAIEIFDKEISLGKNIFLLPSKVFGSQEVANLLKQKNIDAQICVYENIGYPEERALIGSVTNPPLANSDMYCILVVQK